MIMLAPEQRAGVVVLINMDGGDASSLATDLMRIVLESEGVALLPPEKKKD
jgi:hypothetical protein